MVDTAAGRGGAVLDPRTLTLLCVTATAGLVVLATGGVAPVGWAGLGLVTGFALSGST